MAQPRSKAKPSGTIHPAVEKLNRPFETRIADIRFGSKAEVHGHPPQSSRRSPVLAAFAAFAGP